MNEMKVADVMVACDTIECGYRIVELEDGRHAFVWGNIESDVGDVLPQEKADSPTYEKGVDVFESYEEAEMAYRRCAKALQQCSRRAGDEMLAVLS